MRKTKNILKIFFTIVNIFIFSEIFSQNYPIYNYSTKDYGQNRDASNWCVLQDKFGTLYFGNSNGIITYNGKSWNFISVKESKWVISLAIDGNGIIYVGSQTEFGYLLPDKTGNLEYISISDSLPLESMDFGNIWKINTLDDEIYFHSEEKIFRYKNNEVTEFLPETYFHLAFLSSNQYFVRQPGAGLMQLKNDNFELIPEGEKFAEKVIIEILDKEPNISLIITKSDGIYEYNTKTEKLTQIVKNYSDTILNSGMYGAIMLNDKNIALNTINLGIIIITPKGEILKIINEDEGLRKNKVYYIIQDFQNNIWAALENGISKIDYSSPFEYFNEENGIYGNIRCITEFENQFYVGTSLGLFKSSDKNNFVQVPEFENEVWSFLTIEDELLIGTKDFLYSLKNQTIKKLYNIDAYSVYYSKKTETLFLGGNMGLFLFKKENNYWKQIKSFDELWVDIKGIAENNYKSELTEIWIGTSSNGVFRIDFDENFDYSIDNYSDNDGLDEGWVIPFNYGDTAVFACNDGLYKFINEELVKEMLPDSLKNDPKFYRGFFENMIINNDTLSRFPVYNFLFDKNIILSFDNSIYLFEKNKNTIYTDFFEIDKGRINCFYRENNNYWIGSDEALIYYNSDKKREINKTFYTFFTSVKLNSDSLIFSNYYLNKDKIEISQPSDLEYEFNYKNNSITFGFVSPCFSSEDKILYSYKLENFDETWSEWTSNTSKEFTNLREGDYIFKAKAKNVFETQSQEVAFSFTILPPWYRTNIAYILYVVLGILLIYLVVKISIYRLKQQNIKLEEIVRQRTAEINAKNKELSLQKDIIVKKNEDIISSINYASKIQQALFPSLEILQNSVSDFFVLNRPRDIVSGDFYWVTQKNNKIVVVVADCTGHGVPGAFMSLLGIAFLNEIINEIEDIKPDTINNLLRRKVITSLHQSESSVSKDGMDNAICVIDKTEKTILYSGAYNPLYLIRNKELTEYKADRMPIGYHLNNEKPFSIQKIEFQENDAIYMFSDGYADQFGGEEGKKFKYIKLKNTLVEVQSENMSSQKQIINATIQEWMDCKDEENNLFPQVDDILMMGIKL